MDISFRKLADVKNLLRQKKQEELRLKKEEEFLNYFQLTREPVLGSRVGTVVESYKALVSALGDPTFKDEDGDTEMTSEWSFKSAEGEKYSIYDYKLTDYANVDGPSVEEFRQTTDEYEFSIGSTEYGRGRIGLFIKWLKLKGLDASGGN